MTAVPSKPSNGFRVDPAELAALVTERTRLIILNSPHNPCGSVLTAADVEAIARIAIEHDLVVLSDEINEADWDISQAVHAAGVSGAASQEVEQAVLEAHKSWWIAVFVGLVLTLWTGRSLARALTMMHAHVWEMPVPRQSQSQRLVNGVLLLFVFLFAVFASAVTSRLNVLSWFLGAAALTVVVGVGWLLISKWLPNRATSWASCSPARCSWGWAWRR